METLLLKLMRIPVAADALSWDPSRGPAGRCHTQPALVYGIQHSHLQT